MCVCVRVWCACVMVCGERENVCVCVERERVCLKVVCVCV